MRPCGESINWTRWVYTVEECGGLAEPAGESMARDGGTTPPFPDSGLRAPLQRISERNVYA